MGAADGTPEFRSGGVEIIRHPDTADQIVQQLRDAVTEFPDDCAENDIAEHGP